MYLELGWVWIHSSYHLEVMRKVQQLHIRLQSRHNYSFGRQSARITHRILRNCNERFNGAFKIRFRTLLRHRVLHDHRLKAAKIIYSCAILHNVAIYFDNDNPGR
ncbi:hypothetical protein HUJ04_011284 [Dendroctonus ponderosae]|nr:hypothetical protein HUJ04_011284 [Dendroctonus ponderosae]